MFAITSNNLLRVSPARSDADAGFPSSNKNASATSTEANTGTSSSEASSDSNASTTSRGCTIDPDLVAYALEPFETACVTPRDTKTLIEMTYNRSQTEANDRCHAVGYCNGIEITEASIWLFVERSDPFRQTRAEMLLLKTFEGWINALPAAMFVGKLGGENENMICMPLEHPQIKMPSWRNLAYDVSLGVH
jgi:hypothetical protein